MGTITINIFLPMRNKFLNSCSIKIRASGLDELLESIFCLRLVVKVFSLQKGVETLEEVVVGWGEARWIWQMRQDLVAQLVQLSKRWLCDARSGVVVGKDQALSVDQRRLQAPQFFIDLPSVLLRCNVFTRIQKAVVDQTGSRPPKVTMTLCGASLVWEMLWSCFLVQSLTWLSYKTHFSSHIQSNWETIHCCEE